jgi:hypothetical protein
VTDAQVKAIKNSLERDNNVTHAAMKGNMDRKTARRYRDLGVLLSEHHVERMWRTRQDPFVEDWDDMLTKLNAANDLDAKTLFEDLVARRPGRYEPGQLRTLQRKVKRWRAQEGSPKPVFFAQNHRPGEAMQTDFTVCDELRITKEWTARWEAATSAIGLSLDRTCKDPRRRYLLPAAAAADAPRRSVVALDRPALHVLDVQLPTPDAPAARTSRPEIHVPARLRDQAVRARLL